jgi:hypothetical protein
MPSSYWRESPLMRRFDLTCPTITAHLEVATSRYLVSENRDFLKELPALPFTVLIHTGTDSRPSSSPASHWRRRTIASYATCSRSDQCRPAGLQCAEH